ncbi:ribosome biogenesis GTPase YlqF [Alkalibacterium psychrotolerans]
MTIQWYPGHMAKAKRQFKEKLNLVDVVYELVDARIPYSSKNPDIEEMIGNKPHIVVLMKNDLADPKQTKEWIAYYKSKDIPAISINAKLGQGLKEVLKLTKEVLEPLNQKRRDKGMKPRAVRAVCVGIPNVGKSTLINRFAGKNIAQTGNKPGVTKAQQWIKYGKELELLDTPGILWPKFEDQEVGKRLAVTGAIKDTLLHIDDITLYAMEYLVEEYPGALAKRYNLAIEDETNQTLPELMMQISHKRGFRDDYDRAAEMILHEIRNGQLGRLTFEKPGHSNSEDTDD